MDLLKAYMANVPIHKTKIKEMFSNPAHKMGRHYVEMLILKAVYSYFNGEAQKPVALLIKAVAKDAKCVDSLEVNYNFNECEYNYPHKMNLSENSDCLL